MRYGRASAIFTLLALATASFIFCGCGILPTSPDTVEPLTFNENYIIETAYLYASTKMTQIDPHLTDDICSRNGKHKCNSDSPAAAWVPDGGKSHDIYFWRPWVNAHGRTQKQLEALARHEVEHVACQCDLGEGQ